MRRFTVCRGDWSLHRKGYLDQGRHREKVREAIRKNMADLISEESIILSDGRKVVQVPLRAMEEYRFRFDRRMRDLVGQGAGNSQPGDLVGGKKSGRREHRGAAGTAPGLDYYETGVALEELSEIMFAGLHLPRFEPKTKPRRPVAGVEFKDVRKTGITANLDHRRTILNVIRRNALRGRPGLHSITPGDLRFRTPDESEKPQSAAVVLAMMDTSGSMGPFEKYIARTFFFWMKRFLDHNYRNVEIVYLAHHTAAGETTEEAFFSKGESGGTRCSSVYRLALQVIEDRYPPEAYNIYAFHFSDGDNLSSDNMLCAELVQELAGYASLVGYGEIEGPYYYTGTLRSTLEQVRRPNFRTVVVREKRDVYGALKAFFGPDSQ